MKTAIYIRVSTEEQVKEGYSISAQTQKLKAFCISQSWDVENLYIDEGISAKDMERPALQRMLKTIERKEVECVLVYRLDRLTRSVFDLYKMLEVFDKYDCKFKSATEVYDTTTAMGRMFITIVAALAQWERENMGERYSMGYAEKARQGKWPLNFAPIGYDLDKETYVLQINKKEAETIKNIYRLYQSLGMNRVAKTLNDRKELTKDGNLWSDNTIMKVLKNPVYKGKILWNGVIYNGLHKSIINDEPWEETQRLIKERTGKPARSISSNYIFSGKLKCPACGKSMTGAYVDSVYKGNTTRYYQYRCRGKSKGSCSGTRIVSEKELEKSFVDYISSEQLETQLNQVATIGEKKLNEETEAINFNEIEKELEKVEKRKKKWQYAWTEDMISDDDFKERMKEANEKEKELRLQLETEVKEEDEPISITEIINVLKDINKNWDMLEKLEKKSLVNSIIDQMHYHHTTSTLPGVTIDIIDFKVY